MFGVIHDEYRSDIAAQGGGGGRPGCTLGNGAREAGYKSMILVEVGLGSGL